MVRHVKLVRLERVRLGMRGQVEVAGYAVDEHDASYHAPLARTRTDLGLLLGDGLRLVVVVNIVLHKRLERLVRAVPDVRLVRVRVVPAEDAHLP